MWLLSYTRVRQYREEWLHGIKVVLQNTKLWKSKLRCKWCCNIYKVHTYSSVYFCGLNDELQTGLVFYGLDHSKDGTILYRPVELRGAIGLGLDHCSYVKLVYRRPVLSCILQMEQHFRPIVVIEDVASYNDSYITIANHLKHFYYHIILCRNHIVIITHCMEKL